MSLDTQWYHWYLIPLLLVLIQLPDRPAVASSGDSLAGDARIAPAHLAAQNATTGITPDRYQPSAFFAGRVAIQIVFAESNGSSERSTEDWSPDQIASINSQISGALDWWHSRMPHARLSFEISSQIVPTGYEPIQHTLSTEGQWIGDLLTQMGYHSSSYFDQAYTANDSLRQAHNTNWASTIFVVNSANDPDGRFADQFFAYAYINGPFMVITSDSGGYGASQLAPVAAHELGHIFGALDQYAEAGSSCSERSGYLDIPNSNSQVNSCGTHFQSVMLQPVPAYQDGLVDTSALGQIGYRDQDNDGLPDPLDTTPKLDLTMTQDIPGARPLLSGRVVDQPYPSASQPLMTINTISRVEYRVDGGEWFVVPATDGAYNSAEEALATTLPLYDGQHRLELRAVNSVGTASPVLRQDVSISGVGPAPGYGIDTPAMSDTSIIRIGLSAPAGALVQISANLALSEATWLPVQPNIDWRLGQSDGDYDLYIRFRDSAGIESPWWFRHVLLDQQPPNGEAQVHMDATPTLELQAQDGGSGIGDMQLTFATGSITSWQPYQPSVSLPEGPALTGVRLRDLAGNISAPLAIHSNYLAYLPLTIR